MYSSKEGSMEKVLEIRQYFCLSFLLMRQSNNNLGYSTLSCLGLVHTLVQ